MNIRIIAIKAMAFSFIGLSLVGCVSKTQKAEELIKKELFKTLYDYESYEPIETVLEEASASYVYDSNVYVIGDEMAFLKESIDLLREKANENAEEFKYLSGYKLEIAKEKQYRLLDTCYYLSMMWYDKIDDLKHLCGQIDTTVVIGWKATHKFRCKSKDGTPNIVDKIFVFNRDIKNVLYKSTEGNPHDELVITLIDDVVKHENPPVCTAYKLCYSFLSFQIEEYGSFENLLQSARTDQNVYREYRKLMDM
jgi:hypothetical protein